MSTEIVNQEPVSVDKARGREVMAETSAINLPRNVEEVLVLAKIMAASKLYPEAADAPRAAAIMLLGLQFGIPPAQALTAIHVVKGKPMLHYSALLAKIRQHPEYDYEIEETTNKSATVVFYRYSSRRGEWAEAGRSTFTAEDAKRQGTQNMDKFPDTMLLARAVSNGIKRFCPDVLNGLPVYVQGEIPDAGEVPVGSRKDALKAEIVARVSGVAPEVTETAEYAEAPKEVEAVIVPEMAEEDEEAGDLFGDQTQ